MMLIFLLTLGILVNLCAGEEQDLRCLGFKPNVSKDHLLMDCLVNNYRDTVRPVTDSNQVVQVNVSFYLVAVAQVYDKENAVLLETYVGQNWHDYRLKWEPSAYDGISRVFMNYWRIWEPELVVWDNRDSTGTIVEGKKAIVSYTGDVEWISQLRLSTYCRMDHAKFPFDQQLCTFEFQHHVYDSSLVNTSIVYPPDGKMSEGACISIHNEWKVKECNAKIEKVNWKDLILSYISLEIIMERQYSYHYYLIVIPSVLVVLFVLSLLWLPHESNQRFAAAGGMLFVILLTNFVLQQFLPPSIGEVPVVASYLLYSIILLIIIFIISLFTFNLHSKDPKVEVVPDIIKKIFFNLVIGKATCVINTSFVTMPNASLENKTWNEPIQRGGDAFSPGGGEHRTNAFGQNTEKLLEDIRRHLGVLANTPNKTNTNEWKQLSLIIDRLSFYIFFILNIIITTALYAH